MRVSGRRFSILAGVAALLVGASVSTAAWAAPTAPPPACQAQPKATCPAAPAAPVSDAILSNETTFTTWAASISNSAARREPSMASPRVADLHGVTEDGFPEIYIVLRERRVGSTTWAQVRLPMRQADQTGWVARNALDTYNRIATELVLNRATLRLRLYRAGRKVFEAPVGIGRAGRTATPPGHYWIREAFPVRGVSAYGPFAFGTSAYSALTDWPGGGVVGLHGTDQPQLIPGRPSHGCIRVRNADIVRLSRLVSVGTPLLIL